MKFGIVALAIGKKDGQNKLLLTEKIQGYENE